MGVFKSKALARFGFEGMGSLLEMITTFVLLKSLSETRVVRTRKELE